MVNPPGTWHTFRKDYHMTTALMTGFLYIGLAAGFTAGLAIGAGTAILVLK